MFKGKIFIGRWSNYRKVAPLGEKNSQFHSCEGWDILQAIHFFSDIVIPGTMNTMTFLFLMIWFVWFDRFFFFGKRVIPMVPKTSHLLLLFQCDVHLSFVVAQNVLGHQKNWIKRANKYAERKKYFSISLRRNLWIKSGLIAGWRDPYILYFTFTHYTFAFWCVLLRLDGKKRVIRSHIPFHSIPTISGDTHVLSCLTASDKTYTLRHSSENGVDLLRHRG